MGTRDVFSKVLPNIKLATRFDADGKEIQVERREDEEQNTKEIEIFDTLVAAGYYRARIKGLSAFDKIVGGMTWCIVACNYDVDVDLLFHENLTIGQKITLTEKIVVVLPKMKCPHQIEPHQIQGLDFIKICPVIQWLVKRSAENRAERAEKLKIFAIGQFHNHFSLASDRDAKEKFLNATSCIKEVQSFYSPRRKYKRKDAATEDERTRVRVTLLEYGDKGITQPAPTSKATKSTSHIAKTTIDDEILEDDEDIPVVNEIDVDQLLKNLYIANEDENAVELNETDKTMILKNFTELMSEMSIDTKQLSEQSQIKTLLATKTILEKKLHKIQENNRLLEHTIKDERDSVEQLTNEIKGIKADIENFDATEIKFKDKVILDKIQALVVRNEELRQSETKFKEQCRQELANLQEEIKEAELPTPEAELHEIKDTMEKEKERLQAIRSQLAKKNRAVVSIERQLDSIPDRPELTQYQHRFLELYNQVSATHRETKQYYTLYNTLNDTKQYLTKELSLLNSIYENYADGFNNTYAKEQFVAQFDIIVDGVRQTKQKVRNKFEDEKAKRDGLNAQLLSLVEQQRKYATALKQFTKDCERNEQLMRELKQLKKAIAAARATTTTTTTTS